MQRIALALVTSLALSSCSPAGSDESAKLPTDRKMHFTAADLKKLGCIVDVSPRNATIDKPFIGRIESHGWPDGPACASEFLSTLRSVGDDTDGTWAGLDAATRIFAREHGYEIVTYEGNVGEYSQLDVFTSAEEERGFRYTVEDHGRMLSITLISDRISPSESFEEILREKLQVP